MQITILTETEIRQCVTFNEESLMAISNGFQQLSDGLVTVPPIVRMDIEKSHGEIDIKTAYIHNLNSLAIKIASGFNDNYLAGLPTGNGMMVLVSTKTGAPEAVLLDNGYLTDLRTGLAGALAGKYLAKEKINTVGVVGSGAQARYQVLGLRLVRDFERVLVYGIIPDQVNEYARKISDELRIEVTSVMDLGELVQKSDVVLTTTPSRHPYLKTEWLHPGLHITCMGADAVHKQELFADVFSKVDRIACDYKPQVLKLGEIHHAVNEGILPMDAEISEIGEIISGRKLSRQNDQEITVCDLTGVGVQDTAIALLAFQAARQKGLGTVFEV